PTRTQFLHPFPTRRSSDLGNCRTDQDTYAMMLLEHCQLAVHWRVDNCLCFQVKKISASRKNISTRNRYASCGRNVLICLTFRRADRKSTRLNSSHVKISYA